MAANKADLSVKELKKRLDEDELDLTMLELTQVPVKQMAQLPKATKVDLSVNQLSTLPDDFALQLTHLVKLDLSDNKLRLLPDNFGELRNLEHLDLYKNKLESLPVSVAKMKSLKWLDLKDNPLEPELMKVAGDCLDEKQCKRAASRMLQHMANVQAEVEREKQRRLDIERERKTIEEAEKREQQLAKKREKDRRKQDKPAPPPVPPKKKSLVNGQPVDNNSQLNKHSAKNGKRADDSQKDSSRPGFFARLKSCFACLFSLLLTILFALFISLLALAAVFYNNCSSQIDAHWLPNSEPLCHDILHWSASGNMPEKVPEHTRMFLTGVNDWASAKTTQLVEYDYSHTWQNTQELVTRASAKSVKFVKRTSKRVGVWWEKEARPRLSTLLQWLQEQCVHAWHNANVYGAIAAQYLYQLLQHIIAAMSSWLRYLVEQADYLYQHRQEYFEKAKTYWQNLK